MCTHFLQDFKNICSYSLKNLLFSVLNRNDLVKCKDCGFWQSCKANYSWSMLGWVGWETIIFSGVVLWHCKHAAGDKILLDSLCDLPQVIRPASLCLLTFLSYEEVIPLYNFLKYFAGAKYLHSAMRRQLVTKTLSSNWKKCEGLQCI